MCIAIEMLCYVRAPFQMRNVRFSMELYYGFKRLWSIYDINHFIHTQMMHCFCVVSFFGHSKQTQSTCAMYRKCLPYICDVLKIIAITFLLVFEILFSQYFEIQYYKKYSSNISEKYSYIMIQRYSLKLKSLA